MEYEIPKTPCVAMLAKRVGMIHDKDGKQIIHDETNPYVEVNCVPIHSPEQMGQINGLRKKGWAVVGHHNLETLVNDSGQIKPAVVEMISELNGLMASPEMAAQSNEPVRAKKKGA